RGDPGRGRCPPPAGAEERRPPDPVRPGPRAVPGGAGVAGASAAGDHDAAATAGRGAATARWGAAAAPATAGGGRGRFSHPPMAWTPPSTWTISPLVAGNQSDSRATH